VTWWTWLMLSWLLVGGVTAVLLAKAVRMADHCELGPVRRRDVVSEERQAV
jgi:hypothetical protein